MVSITHSVVRHSKCYKYYTIRYKTTGLAERSLSDNFLSDRGFGRSGNPNGDGRRTRTINQTDDGPDADGPDGPDGPDRPDGRPTTVASSGTSFSLVGGEACASTKVWVGLSP